MIHMQLTPVSEWGCHFINQFDLSCYPNILDLGCRQGHLTHHLAEKYPAQQFLGIDNVDADIASAKASSLANLAFDKVDALAMSYHDSFDAIVSFNCLLWIKDKQQVLNNLYVALKPGGKLFLQFWIKHGRPQNDRFFYQAGQHSRWQPYVKHRDAPYHEIRLDEFCWMSHSAGFIMHDLRLSRRSVEFAHVEKLQQWFKSWAPCLQQIPRKKQDCFLNDAANAYLDFHGYSQASAFPYHEYLLEAVLEKPTDVESTLFNEYRFKGITLSQREAQVLKYYLQGKSAKEIAAQLPISAKTVEFHLAKVKNKLNCYKRSEIFQVAMSCGFMHIATGKG